jgi:hypothetical protein
MNIENEQLLKKKIAEILRGFQPRDHCAIFNSVNNENIKVIPEEGILKLRCDSEWHQWSIIGSDGYEYEYAKKCPAYLEKMILIDRVKKAHREKDESNKRMG